MQPIFLPSTSPIFMQSLETESKGHTGNVLSWGKHSCSLVSGVGVGEVSAEIRDDCVGSWKGDWAEDLRWDWRQRLTPSYSRSLHGKQDASQWTGTQGAGERGSYPSHIRGARCGGQWTEKSPVLK